MKNIEIVGIVNAFAANKDSSMKLPASVAWKRRLNMKTLTEAKAVIDEALQEIGKRYADDEHSVEGENGQRNVKPEYMADYAKETGEILVQETDVTIRKIKIEDIGDITLSDADMDTLAFMIEEGE